MKKDSSIFIILLVFLVSGTALGQEKSAFESEADQLHKLYKFDQSIELYKKLLEQSSDSLYKISIENKLILSENGKALLEFASSPQVLATAKHKASDFFLHYPGFPDNSWVPLQKELAEGDIKEEIICGAPVVWFPSGSKKIFYSAPDNSGSWNIYSTQKINDTLWSAPAVLNENITSVGNELFPVLSRDGKSLYFSSNGHYGIGGYDLYVSNWDDDLNDWGVAQNLGFPFSSVSDDLLFYNTPDGLYSVFASNRNSAPDEMTVYAVKFENIPLKKDINWEQAEEIAQLKAPDKEQDNSTEQAGAPQKNEGELSSYTIAVKNVRKLQQDAKTAIQQQKENRALYNTLTNTDDLTLLEKKIAEQETKTLTMQQELGVAMEKLQVIEMDFLSKGIMIPDTQEQTNDTKPLGDNIPPFMFANNSLGTTPAMIVEVPIPQIDLSFRILDKAVIADAADFPTSLTYQIQLFVLANKATLKALKGLSPVFERKAASGKYIYSVGTFHTYADALKNINKVKKLGFPTALITAYREGKALTLKNARLMEQKEAATTIYRVVIEGYDTLPAESLNAIRTNTEKDIAKTIENGTPKYVVGPFANRSEADALKAALDKTGVTTAQVEKVEKN